MNLKTPSIMGITCPHPSTFVRFQGTNIHLGLGFIVVMGIDSRAHNKTQTLHCDGYYTFNFFSQFFFGSNLWTLQHLKPKNISYFQTLLCNEYC